MNEHPNRFTLERSSAGDLPPAARDEVAFHVAACLVCRAYLKDLDDAKLALDAADPPDAVVARLSSLRGRRAARNRRIGIAAMTSLAALAALFLLIPQRGPDLLESHTRGDIRLKGAGVT